MTHLSWRDLPDEQANPIGAVQQMLELVDYYAILQVDPRAEAEVIRAAHRALARKYHPDVVGGSETRMVAINQAWAVLGSPRDRRAYDKSRSALASQAAAPKAQAPEPYMANGGVRPSGPPSGTVLDFGRYAGWSFGQIARHDPDFLEWLARAPIGRSFRTEIEAILAARPRPMAAAPARRHAPASPTAEARSVRSSAVDFEFAGELWYWHGPAPYHFITVTTFVDGASLMITQDGPHNLPELAGRTIGGLAGTTTEQTLRNSLGSAGITAEVIPAKTHAEGLQLLENGKTSAYFADRSILMALIANSKAPENLRLSDAYLTIETYALALPHGDDDLRLEVDRALSHIYGSGEITSLLGHTFGNKLQPGPMLQMVYLLSGLPD